MSMVGDRVMAVLDFDGNARYVRVFGEGVFEGAVDVPGVPGIKVERVRLDGGKHVWAHECRIFGIDRLTQAYPKPYWQWVQLDIDQYRKEQQ